MAASLRIGTRGSPLARWQAEWVAGQLQHRGATVELVPIKTEGDVQTAPLGQIGGQGLFTKELQRALLDGRIDLAVHSLKDLPTAPVEGLVVATVPERESTRDVLVAGRGGSLEALPPGARIGTGSLRRKAQLLYRRRDLVVEDIRGNVETRLKKLDDGQFDAIVLAEAGLKRLGLADRITQVLSPDVMLSAVGQGALGIETRADDRQTHDVLAPLDHHATHQAVIAERSLLFALRAGCLAPVAALAVVEGGRLSLSAVVLSAEGARKLAAGAEGAPEQAVALGQRAADDLLQQGAADLIAASRSAAPRVDAP